jgi:hypothetical protein
MSAATGTILTIAALGATTGASIYGAKKASSAAKTASAQQTQSAQEALALQKSMYDTTRGDLAPYRESGQQGLTALSSFLLGRPNAYGPASAGATAVSRGLTPTPLRPAPGAAGAPMGVPSAPPAAPAGAPPSAPMGGPPPGMVPMRSPSGAMGYVPQARVPDALAAGGSVVR